MRLSWSDIRWLYEIPRDVHLPESPAPASRAIRSTRTPVVAVAIIFLSLLLIAIAVRHLSGDAALAQLLSLPILGLFFLALITLQFAAPHMKKHRAGEACTISPNDPLPPTTQRQLLRITRAPPNLLAAALFTCIRCPFLPVVGFLATLNLLITGSYPLNFVMFTVFVLLLLMLLIPVVAWMRRFRARLIASACTNCGYDLLRIAPADCPNDNHPHWSRCPECGELSPVHITAPTAAPTPSQH